eukprot:1160713-Pelagomonas_calceolata.AAC.1
MAKSSEHANGPFMASAFRVHQFVREKFLLNRPYMSLCLGKTYVVPAEMYAGQVWGSKYIKASKEKKKEKEKKKKKTMRKLQRGLSEHVPQNAPL